MDLESNINIKDFSIPEFINEAEILIKELKKYDSEKISKLMRISPQLSKINYERFQNWNTNFDDESRQAIFTYFGQVYKAMNAYNFSNEDISFSQDNLRIISALYGLLRPLDKIRPYRLEMSCKISFMTYKNLYEFWTNKITESLNKQLCNMKDKVILNLCSEEYFKAIDIKKVYGKVVSIEFKELKNGIYRNIGTYAKHARGLMISYIIKNKIEKLKEIYKFDEGGYSFNKDFSEDTIIVFTRKQ
ncbi:MAG: hypothetical protein K0R54_1178 [Clostridiaceae bacterium]|nr:hypothetical protein [Clostridiaceae bacterium]